MNDGHDIGEEITAIRPVAGDPLRCAVKVGRRTVARLGLDEVERLGLAVGVVWDSELARRTDEAAAGAAARRDALRAVSRRMIGTEELRQRLLRKGHAERHVGPALERLSGQGLLDDAAYGRAVIEQTKRSKPTGRRMLEAKLMQKRLPRDLIRRLLDESEAEAATTPAADARRLAEKKLATTAMQRADLPTRQRRLWSLLARRGFDSDTIRDALEELDTAGGEESG